MSSVGFQQLADKLNYPKEIKLPDKKLIVDENPNSFYNVRLASGRTDEQKEGKGILYKPLKRTPGTQFESTGLETNLVIVLILNIPGKVQCEANPSTKDIANEPGLGITIVVSYLSCPLPVIVM